MASFTIELDIEDVVESAVSNELDNILEERIDSDISNRDFATQDDVRNALSDYVTEDQIAAAVRDELTNCDFAEANDVLDEDDVERIAERTARDVLAASDLATDLARRLDLYNQRVDELRGQNTTLVARLDNMQAKLDAFEADTPLTPRVEALEAKLESGDVGQALTFFGLLKQAFAALR